MAKAALTPARIEVLSALAQGAHAERAQSWEWVRYPDGRTTKLRRGTLNAMAYAGWIESSALDIRTRKFVITDAGRAVLEQKGRANDARVKLTPTRIEILRLLANGWQAGRSDGNPYQAEWMQQGGIGKGGQRKEIRRGTLQALHANGFVGEKPGHTSHLKVFDLTDMGRAAIKQGSDG